MPRRPLFAFLLLFFVATSVMSCKKDSDPALSELVGTWKLTSRDGCYCPQAPVPDERITFSDTNFSIYKANQLTSEGTYSGTTAPVVCSSTTRVPALRMVSTSGTVYQAAITINGSTLMLDYRAQSGGCLSDVPVDTYERLP
jgi:hypothetical protein